MHDRKAVPMMRILLIAHDFPPIESPQALRWGYLVRELQRFGHQVQVLCALPPGQCVAPARSEGLTIISVAQGGVLSAMQRVGRRMRSRSGQAKSGAMSPRNAEILNWRGRARASLTRWIDWFQFPDNRRSWLGPARRALEELLRHEAPDLLISSHEPAVTLLLGEEGARQGLPWIADLGDPVLTGYTLPHWRGAAKRLESRVCHKADALITTNASTRSLLADRHAVSLDKFKVIAQGFEPRHIVHAPRLQDEPLRLLYTGRFYQFRSGRELFEAVVNTPGVILEVATTDDSPLLRQYAERHPDTIRILGRLSHEAALAAQQDADVLVCIGNTYVEQTPGKIYEYLGSARPLLYVAHDEDPVVPWITGIRRGWVSRATTLELTECLSMMRERKRLGTLEAGLDLSLDSVSEHSWRSRGEILVGLCTEIVERARSRGMSTSRENVR